MPVLREAAGALDACATQTWRQHPVAGRWWPVVQAVLRQAQPVEARTVVDVILTQAPYSMTSQEDYNAAVAFAEAARLLPEGARVTNRVCNLVRMSSVVRGRGAGFR